jgi:hypothetical protein
MAPLQHDLGQRPRLAPTAPHLAPLFAFGLLTAASALASFVFACATPFSAFAVIAAALLPLRTALLVVTGTCLVNQTIGYGALHYPINANSISWGVVLGLASLAATVAAKSTLNATTRMATPIALAISLVAAYAVYEVTLFAFTPVLGGTEGFTTDIVARIGALSALWLAGLVAACEVARLTQAKGRERTR